MTKKKKTVEFEEGWADELDLTPDELADLVRGITQLVETGEILEEMIPVEELDEEEREEIYERLARKNTRH
jgi:hypothetical protein